MSDYPQLERIIIKIMQTLRSKQIHRQESCLRVPSSKTRIYIVTIDLLIWGETYNRL